ncbi:cytochrome oxidase putative small subunit CydP [Legionella sp.]|uniref:cytochrome oxidase putative small subunit CydP n=1 Tax=Legionella sp. TaxID=459 RepID=UPI003CB321F1
MIKPLTRDILLTLIIKFSLLFLLWSVCFKNIEKSNKNIEQQLLGTVQQSQS